MTDPEPGFSEVYRRYNGCMLGLFFGAAKSDGLADQFPRLIGRMQEFLDEIGSLPFLPGDRTAFVKHHGKLVGQLGVAVELSDEGLAGFMHLGLSAWLYVLLTRGGDPTGEADMLRAQAVDHLQSIDIPPEALDRFVEGTTVLDGVVTYDSLHSAALDFVGEILRPLPVDESTAFVIMPFELSDRYTALYLPVLRKLGLRGFRAWGGIQRETYQELMVSLIGKCGTCLVELTGLNPNVLYEVGLAHGLGRKVLPIIEADARDVPANLGDLKIGRYDPTHGWPDAAVLALATIELMTDLGKDLERASAQRRDS